MASSQPLDATVKPAKDCEFIWAVQDGTGSATIEKSSSGSTILKWVKEGTVTVTATANDGSGVTTAKEFTIAYLQKVSDFVKSGTVGQPISPVTITFTFASAGNTVRSFDNVVSDEFTAFCAKYYIKNLPYGLYPSFDGNNADNTVQTFTIHRTPAAPNNSTAVLNTSIKANPNCRYDIKEAAIVPTPVPEPVPNKTSFSSGKYTYNITQNTAKARTVTMAGFAKGQSTSKLTSVTIGNKVKTISDYAFSKCTSLKKVTIGKHVFCDNKKLTSITIKSRNLTKVGSHNLSKCKNLKIKVPSSKVKSYKKLFKN